MGVVGFTCRYHAGMGASGQFSMWQRSRGVAGVLLLLAASAGFVRWANGEYVVQRFDCGARREILILAERSWEVGQGCATKCAWRGNCRARVARRFTSIPPPRLLPRTECGC